jgi:transcription antitermination factor NusG
LTPLFPGYVFVEGSPTKAEFLPTRAAVDVLQATETQRLQLHEELCAIWRGLSSGSPLELTRELKPGHQVEVVAGALKGVQGRFERWGNSGRLILWVDMLGAGAAIEISDTSVVRLL